MIKKSRLSKARQALVVKYLPLAQILSRYFVATRPHGQRTVRVDDLLGEGYLALVKAARTYDRARLPYPKAYFARAILNAMYKAIKRAVRQPGEVRISMAEAADLLPDFDHMDHLRLAIAELPEDDQPLANDRFVAGLTLRALALAHQIPLRQAARRSSQLAGILAGSLGIQLMPRDAASRHHKGSSSPDFSPSSQVSCASSRDRSRPPGN